MQPRTPLSLPPEHLAKVPIARGDGRRPHRSSLPGSSREDRVARACNACRKRKIKCSGHHPECHSCRANGLECAYEQARRDRLKEAVDLTHTVVALLQDVKARLGHDDVLRINTALEHVESDMLSPTSALSPTSGANQPSHLLPAADQEHDAHHAASHVPERENPTHGLDSVREDLSRNHKSRNTGYVGQNSEIQWLHSVQRHMEREQPDSLDQPHPHSPRETGKHAAYGTHQDAKTSPRGPVRDISDTSFYLDSHDIQVDFAVDPYALPDAETALKLFDCYIHTAYTSFPVVPSAFEIEFHDFMAGIQNGRAYQVPTKWRAMMNLIFAIGAKYSHLINADWRGDERDHLVYMTRATRLLGLEDIVMVISGPDEPLVQATGLLAFYFLTVGHVSRAWIVIGLSIRLALALGFHLRNEDPSTAASKKEATQTTWWSLHAVECLISSITGRPPVIAFEDCSVPLPNAEANATPNRSSPTESESSSTLGSSKQGTANDWHFSIFVSLNLITQKALLHLYSPRAASQSWEFIQKKITELLNDVDQWKQAALPRTYDNTCAIDSSQNSGQQHYMFKLYYYSTKILITRPCLCRFEPPTSSAGKEAVNFDAQAAQVCVEAALNITKLLPHDEDPLSIYMIGPWWSVVHLVMQSLAVLLLKMAYQQQQNDTQTDVKLGLTRLIDWLRIMRSHNPVAARAYDVALTILKAYTPLTQTQPTSLRTRDTALIQSIAPVQQASRGIHPADLENLGNGSFTDPVTSGVYFDQQNTTVYSSEYGQLPVDQITPPKVFGNPFFTNFDQANFMVGVPNVQSQAEHFAGLDLNFSIMDGLEHQALPNPGLYPWMQQQFSGKER